VDSKSNVIHEKEMARLVTNLMLEGSITLAATYGVQTQEDLVPVLRRYLNEEVVQEYADLVEVLR